MSDPPARKSITTGATGDLYRFAQCAGLTYPLKWCALVMRLYGAHSCGNFARNCWRRFGRLSGMRVELNAACGPGLSSRGAIGDVIRSGIGSRGINLWSLCEAGYYQSHFQSTPERRIMLGNGGVQDALHWRD